MWWWHSVLVVGCFLTQGTQAYAPITWMQRPASGRTVMPKGFKGWSSVNTVPPQDLVIGSPEKTFLSNVPHFTAKSDNSITWDDMGWCVEASGRASGDAVRVNQCNGDAAQKWNWIPDGHGRNMIQLKDTNKCLDVKKGDLHDASIELRDCTSQMTDAWKFEDSPLLPTLAPAAASGIWQALVSLLSIAGVGMLGLGAYMWRLQNKARVVAAGQGGVSVPMSAGGDIEANIRSMASSRRAGNVSMMARAKADVDWSKKVEDGSAFSGTARATSHRATPIMLGIDPESLAIAAEQKTAVSNLMEGLRKEYDSFFQPFMPEFYSPTVAFADPIISFIGLQKYKNNVDMLAGVTPLGKKCFTDCRLELHNIKETTTGLQTRWTLQFKFKLLPWAPVAQFTGVSKYTLDADKRVLTQQDYWDSINLQPGGAYAPVSRLAGLSDLLGQLRPPKKYAKQAADREMPYMLLRRAKDYEVRRYPQYVAATTYYYIRSEGLGTLASYTTAGGNEADKKLDPYVPSLMSVQQTNRTQEEVFQDEYNQVQPEEPKAMRWPIAVPALGEPTPPQAQEWLPVQLDFVPSRVVAVYKFSDITTESTVRGRYLFLAARLREDGLVPTDGEPEELFRLAQFDAMNSFVTRRSEIWVDLEDHPWMKE